MEMTSGLLIGGAFALGWAGRLIRKALLRPESTRMPAALGSGAIFAVRTAVGTIPAVVVGIVALVIGLKYPVIQIPAGLFLAWAISFLVMYLGIWAAR